MSQMKSLIKLMSDTILFLAETIENITKTNIHKIVAIVASSLGSKKESEYKQVYVAEVSITYDECSFKSINEPIMIQHMSKEHIEYAKSCSCDLCGTYFGNRHLLAEHNTKEHSSDEQTEDIIEVESETSKHDCNYFPAKFKYLDELKWHIE